MRLGNDKQAKLLAVFLLISASICGQAGKNFKYQLNGNLQKSDIITGDHSFTINYSISELDFQSIVNEQGSFFRVSIPGHTPTSIPGQPELPVLSRLISIPEGSVYKVKISEVRSSRINPKGKKIAGILFPVQEGETKDIQQIKPQFKIDKNLYSSKDIISYDTVRIELLGTVRNKKLANLYIFPVRYNPHQNVLEVITSMKIEVIFSDKDNIEPKILEQESALFNESLNKGVLDYNPDDVITGYSEQPVTMVIITDTIFKKGLKPFIKWKTQKGYKLKILYKGVDLAGNTYTQLKDTLTKIYQAATVSNPAPEYLLIIGDVNIIPYYGTGNVTDMYYGEFDGGGDYIPDMYIGRLPVADTAELNGVVKKIIQYEKFQFAETNKFYSNSIALTGYDAGYSVYMNGQIRYAITNYLTTANKINGKPFFHFPDLKFDGALLARKDSVIKAINDGASFINYTGHGDESTWLHLGFVMDTSKLNNKNMYPFVISNACQTSSFNISSSLGNKMVVSANKGAIGFIGCSNDSYWDEDYYWAVGAKTPSLDPIYQETSLGAYDRLFHTSGESPSDWYITMGQVNYAGNLAVSESTTSRKKYYWETYNLVGDPSIIPILGQPGTFNISLPDILPNGIKSLSLNVDPFAYVAVSHFDTLWDASFASPSGSVVLDMPGLSNDSCLIVITGQNKKPIIKTIYFSAINSEYINLTTTGINDTPGNNNGRADFGETFFLKLTVSNLGLTDAHGLYAKISSTSDWITFNSDSVFIGTLAARSDIVLSNDLSMIISGSVPDLARITFRLIIKDDKSTKNFTIDISVHAPQLQIISCIMDDTAIGNGNHVADPGETFNLVFKIRNQGSSNTSGQFHIYSPDAGITISEPSVKSGELKFGEITNIPILVTVSESVASGSFISVSSTLDCNPYLINKNFTFRVGRVRESFEASLLNIFPWINVSSVPWTISETGSYDGNLAARSGAISHNGTTSLIIKTFYPNPDSLKFFFKVSSEINYDYLSFRLNGTEIFRKSGDIAWTKRVVPVPAGLNVMEWIYRKDVSVSSGQDCAWIDLIDFATTGSVNYIQKDLGMMRIVTPVHKVDYSQEAISVKVRNLGKEIIKGFNLAYKVNNMPPVKQLFDNTISYNDSVTVTFKTKANLSKYGVYQIAIYGYNNSDDYILNDTVHIKIANTKIDEPLIVYPNPFRDELNIVINSGAAGDLFISLTNSKGIRLYAEKKQITSGMNEIFINKENTGLSLLPGIYFLNITGTGINKKIPVIKQNQ